MAGTSRLILATVMGTDSLEDGNVRPSRNIYYYLRDASAVTFNKANFSAAFVTTMLAPMLAALSVSYTANGINIRAADDPLDLDTFFTNAGVGAVSGDSLPPDKVVVMKMDCGIRGRKYRGKKFYSPVAKQHTLKDEINGSGPVGLWHDVRDAIRTPFTVDGVSCKPVVFSRTILGIGTTPAEYWAASNVITGCVMNLNLGRQKRRAFERIPVVG